MSKAITLDTLEIKLKEHDWTFQYSDDHGYWTAGNQQQKEIKRQVEKLQQMGLTKKVNKLFYKHYPNDGCDIPELYGITKEWRDHLEDQLFNSLEQDKYTRVH